MLVVACPGQGAQSPGMLTPWLELPGFAADLAHAGDVVGLDLVGHGTTSSAETIRDTAVAQPLLVASALASLRVVLDAPAGTPFAQLTAGAVDVVAGHSVGELGAAAVAGVLTDDEALTLVAVRGSAMARAAAVTPTGMSAVLGGDPDEVLARLAALDLVPANVNSSGQVVAAGELPALAALAADPPARARIIPLQVAGAFHTRHMAPAVDELAAAAGRVTPGAPTLTLLGNADGAAVASGEDALARLVAQVARPVRWDLCQTTLADLGVTALLEVAPGGVLTGLARRTLPGVETVALKTPADLDAARDLVRRHAGPAASQDLTAQENPS
ncbi:ACP S-malonyltransferase [Cellulomonas oligotrophica]|uniref:[acyl-carrier-protein] S-malonyltransferase n=1 Tax=Cellulomonas oligotrophica TaxID=931536 RepID=A0A7Y9JVV8_9CELL|nr:ACP S-malonyltransferase [Cellulomonas oligotrophica]NYD85038.1 [acyl-carrier-protein] S-malonyltransferase [Cellulomonas oligotrophica]GIG33743.1 ACP S-malonyltransferase [Cellulomonas oligotrophica]